MNGRIGEMQTVDEQLLKEIINVSENIFELWKS